MAKEKKSKTNSKKEKEKEQGVDSLEEGLDSQGADIAGELEDIGVEIPEDWELRYDRLFAEFQNYRSRTDKEKALLIDLGFQKGAELVLPAIDDLDRALEMATDKAHPLCEGVEMTYKNILEGFQKEGIHLIEAVGKPFDPKYHHAVSTEVGEGMDSNMVIKEYQKGFMYKDKVLRYSMVVVSE